MISESEKGAKMRYSSSSIFGGRREREENERGEKREEEKERERKKGERGIHGKETGTLLQRGTAVKYTVLHK